MLRKFTAFVPRYRKFESISLHRRVSCELDPRRRRHVPRDFLGRIKPVLLVWTAPNGIKRARMRSL